MRLKDIIDKLSGAELSNVFDFDTDTRDVCEASVKKLLPQLQLGLDVLHRRFHLKEQTSVVNLSPGVLEYTLPETDILRIEKVADLDGNEFLLDILGEPLSIRRTSTKTLVLPQVFQKETGVTTLVVTYRASAERLPDHMTHVDPAYVEVDLPYQFLEPLTLFIASQFLNPMGAGEGFHEGNNYAAKYEQACQLLEMQNYDLDRHDGVDRLHNAGWV